MSFLRNLFGAKTVDGEALALSTEKKEFAQIELLSLFQEAQPAHDSLRQQHWSRSLPSGYDETLNFLQKEGWLEAHSGGYKVTEAGERFVELYTDRLAREKAEVMPLVRNALAARDAGEALDIRRKYESRQPLGTVAWSGPEPQMSHSSLTRRILYLDHWLLEGYSSETVDWLKLYAAEQHMWGAYWRLPQADIPSAVQQELVGNNPALDVVETAYWRAYQLALYVDNQETWQRCNGGDHVRRIEVLGPNDDHTCDHCRESLGQQFLVNRVPELPHRECESIYGCRCRYEPVLESYSNLEG